jgi:hypothetical protein
VNRPLRRVTVAPGPGYDPAAWYWSIPAVAQLRTEGLDLDSGVTVLVGENGSGKSTLVEALAAAWSAGLTAQVRHWSPVPADEDADLGRHLRLDGERPAPKAAASFAARRCTPTSAGLGGDHRARSDGVPLNAPLARGWVPSPPGVPPDRSAGLYLLDEPEAALSFRSCLPCSAAGRRRSRPAPRSCGHPTFDSPLLAAAPGPGPEPVETAIPSGTGPTGPASRDGGVPRAPDSVAAPPERGTAAGRPLTLGGRRTGAGGAGTRGAASVRERGARDQA